MTRSESAIASFGKGGESRHFCEWGAERGFCAFVAACGEEVRLIGRAYLGFKWRRRGTFCDQGVSAYNKDRTAIRIILGLAILQDVHCELNCVDYIHLIYVDDDIYATICTHLH
jgi:hypothetical protein